MEIVVILCVIVFAVVAYYLSGIRRIARCDNPYANVGNVGAGTTNLTFTTSGNVGIGSTGASATVFVYNDETWRTRNADTGNSGISGYSGVMGYSGYSGYSGVVSGYNSEEVKKEPVPEVEIKQAKFSKWNFLSKYVVGEHILPENKNELKWKFCNFLNKHTNELCTSPPIEHNKNEAKWKFLGK